MAKCEQTDHAFGRVSIDLLIWLINQYLVDPTDAAVFRSVSKLTRDAVDATGRNLRDERKRVGHERDVQTLREWRESCPQLRDLWREDDTRHWIGVTWRDGRVTRLNLFNQGLSGSLPRLQGLTSLEIANFAHNQLSGSIPEKLFKGLTSLKQVWLDRNPVSGPIPEKLFEGLTSLQAVWLHDNQVSGSIPEGLRGIFKLSECPPGQEDDTHQHPRTLRPQRRLTKRRKVQLLNRH